MAKQHDHGAGKPVLTGQRPPGPGWQRYQPGAPAPGPGVEKSHSARGGGRRRRGRLIGYLLVAILALVVGTGVGYARAYFSDGDVGGAVTVVVKEGSSLRSISQQLEEAGVVRHARAFEIRADADGYAARFMPGTYTLHVNEPYGSLVARLLQGNKGETVKVSIPEGTTLTKASVIVAKDVKTISRQGYVKVARDDPPPFSLQGYKKGTTLEGLLFPATYDVLPKQTSAEKFVKSQLDAFKYYFAKVDMRRARAANLTPYDVVIIASILDREVRVPAERSVAASVIWNRLRDGMALQLDSTVEYALGKTKPVLSYDDLKVDSPYNTYKHKGLPPTPISNPGLASLKAAANPAKTDYLFFMGRLDGTYRHYFSTTYEQFLKDVDKAQANQKANGK